MKTAPRRRIREVISEEINEGEEAEEALRQWDDAPLFSDIDRKKKRIEVISVRRTDPPSGYLGVMPPDMSEARLAAKWGGGTYVLEGKDGETHLVAGARRTIKIAGDPIFASEVEEADYRRSNRLPEKGAGAKGPEQLSAKDLLEIIEEKDERRRKEMAEREERVRAEQLTREERERKERDDRAALALRENEERRERERKDQEEREERRRREQREDDERRARIHREDMERMQQQAANQVAQTQQFYTQLATTLKADATSAAKAPTPGGEVMKAMLTGLQIARELTGGTKDPAEPPDLLTSLVSRLPEVLQEVRATASAAYREVKGNPGTAVAPAAAAGRRRLAADELTIKGKTALKAKRVLRALAAQGKNPEQELDQMLTVVGNALGVKDDSPAETAAEPAPAPAPPRSKPVRRRARAAAAPVKAAIAAAARRPRPVSARRTRGGGRAG